MVGRKLMGKKTGKLEKQIEVARKIATTNKKTIEKTNNRWYGKDDLVKHYIRLNYWAMRINSLKRDMGNIGDFKGIRYFSLCAKQALDVRVLLDQNLLDISDYLPFVFCEYVKSDFEFLRDVFITDKFKGNARGFFGLLSTIATDFTNKDNGEFWSTYPFDVLNLDYLGDIFRAKDLKDNDFKTIQAIINHQSMLRRPYELWITIRVKEGRFDQQVKYAFREIINSNIQDNQKFKDDFRDYYGLEDAIDLNAEQLFLLGYMKWILYISKLSYSVLNMKKSAIIKYKRIGKDSDIYHIYNFLLRIEPYETVVIPTPCCEGAKHSEAEYKKNILKCFIEPIDIDAEYRKLESKSKIKIEENLKKIYETYIKDTEGYIEG